MTTLPPSCCCRQHRAPAASGQWTAVDRLCERGVPNAEARQSPGQAQSLPSFARIPFEQQQQQQPSSFHRSPPANHQKTTLQFQAPSFVHRQPPNALETVRHSSTPPRQSPRILSNCLSAPVQGRPSAQPPPPPPPPPPPARLLHSFGPRRGDAFGQQGLVVDHQPNRGRAEHQPCVGGGGRDPCGQRPQRESAIRSIQQPSHCGDSNHTTPHDRDQPQGVGYNGRDEQTYYEARKYEEEGGGGQENDEYQQMSVHDIKKMFDKPDQKRGKALARIKQQQQHKVWMMTCPAEGSIVPSGYGLSGPGPDQPSSPGKPMTELIHRGVSPSANEYLCKPFFSPRPHAPYGQSPYETTQQPTVSINKQGGGGGGAYVGIRQSVLPSETDQRKSEFDPNQSAAYKILLDEEGGRKTLLHRVNEEERQAETNRTELGPKPLLGGSRLTALLERDAAQVAPYKDRPPMSTHREQASPYHDQRTSYRELPPTRSPYGHEPHQMQRPPPPPPPPPPSHGVPVARHYGAYNHTSPALVPTFYVN